MWLINMSFPSTIFPKNFYIKDTISFFRSLIITAVSPNVVVTVMLKLKEERLGLNGGIHTLIYAMTACNDILAIFLFGVMIGIIFSKGTLF